jgi:ribosomal protein L11 methyltransferase
MSGSRYWELTLAFPVSASEGVTNFVWELGAVGVVEEDIGPGRARLRAFFPETADTDALAKSLDIYLGGLESMGFPRADRPDMAEVTDDNWAEAWRAHFAPFPVGRRFIVAPPWETSPPGDRMVLVLEPGRAFGTGQHGSTASCVEVLEGVVERARPSRALDIGTGSGILALAAAMLGVTDVLAVDSDPDAITAASANVPRNRLEGRVRCAVVDALDLAEEPVPLVLANLLAAAHRTLAPRYARLVTSGGTLIAGGCLDAEADDVMAALTAQGFRPVSAASVEGWTALALEHAPLRDRA